MKVVVAEDYEDLSHRAAAWLGVVMANTNSPTTVVLPTGNTPLGLYRDLAVEPNRHFLKNAQFIQLDEYQGIARNDSRTLAGLVSARLSGTAFNSFNGSLLLRSLLP